MAAGPVPKGTHQRERDTRRRQADVVTLTDDGVQRGPALVGAYSQDTFEWYATWRAAPQAQLFASTDWSRLKVLASMVDAYFTKPSAAALSEIRLNEERLGATYTDRLRAKIRVETGTPALSAIEGTVRPPVSIADRLRREPAPDAAPSF
jgi:predicted acyl esterase